jgi:MFS family permease
MNRNLYVLAISLAFWGFGEGLFLLFQPIYLEQLGADPVIIGFILGGIGAIMTISHFPAGYLSDRIGARPLLIIAWVIGLVATWIMAAATTLPIFVIGSGLYGITAFVISPLNSYTTALRGNMPVGRVLTLISAAYNAGVIGGPIIGGIIGEKLGLRYNFFIAAIVFVFSTIILFNIKPIPLSTEFKKIKFRMSSQIFHNRLFPYLIIVFIALFSIYLPQPLSQNYLSNEQGLLLTQIGILISIRSIGVIFLNLIAGRLNYPIGFIIAQISVGLFSICIWLGNGLPWYLTGYFLVGGYHTAILNLFFLILLHIQNYIL